jgi:hypothetical protein
VKVGNRQAPYAVKFETPVTQNECRGFGVYALIYTARKSTRYARKKAAPKGGFLPNKLRLFLREKFRR